MAKEFIIVEILSESKFIISGGLDDGITDGTKFRILDTKGQEIKNPETGEILGTLDSFKGTVYATTVYDRMSIVESETYQLGGFNTTAAASALRGTTKHTRLKIDYDQLSQNDPTVLSDDPIKIGDTVQKVD